MGTHAGTPRVIPEAKMQELATSLPKVNLKRSSHWDNWLLSIKGQETCRSNFAYGGRLTETMHFANIALHVNRSLSTVSPEVGVVKDAGDGICFGGLEENLPDIFSCGWKVKRGS